MGAFLSGKETRHERETASFVFFTGYLALFCMEKQRKTASDRSGKENPPFLYCPPAPVATWTSGQSHAAKESITRIETARQMGYFEVGIPMFAGCYT
jgi:hypothetical protein